MLFPSKLQYKLSATKVGPGAGGLSGPGRAPAAPIGSVCVFDPPADTNGKGANKQESKDEPLVPITTRVIGWVVAIPLVNLVTILVSLSPAIDIGLRVPTENRQALLAIIASLIIGPAGWARICTAVGGIGKPWAVQALLDIATRGPSAG